MFTKATVSVNLELTIKKQVGDDMTMGKVKEAIELETDKILKKVEESHMNVKVVSQSSFINACFSG